MSIIVDTIPFEFTEKIPKKGAKERDIYMHAYTGRDIEIDRSIDVDGYYIYVYIFKAPCR